MSLQFCLGVGWMGLQGLGDRLGVEIAVSGAGDSSGSVTVVSPTMIHNGLGVGITQRHILRMANATQGVSADPAVFGMAIVNATRARLWLLLGWSSSTS